MPKAPRISEESFNLILLTVVAGIVGMLTGVVAAYFKIFLRLAEMFRIWLTGYLHGEYPTLGFFTFLVICMSATAVAAILVTKIEPHAEGSGIPHVEQIVAGDVGPGRTRILPVKFVGGILAIGAGLMLGREGPLVQMGGTIASTVNKFIKVNKTDLRVIIGAGAAAGLATAFNAPIAGGVFILEELVRRFDVRTTLATLTASSSGFVASIAIVGSETEFRMGPLPPPSLLTSHWIALAGIACGLLGVTYSWLVVFFLGVADAIKIPTWIRAATIGLVISVIGWFSPHLVGGGDYLTQEALWAHGTIWVTLGVLGLRFVLGPVCYAAGTPGGLFAPMLVIGSSTGLLVGQIAEYVQPGVDLSLPAMALVGMAAFFTATVRAPITGLILATEMTGRVAMLPPMLGACALAMLVATALHSEPIYDQLLKRSEKSKEMRKMIAAIRRKKS
ncbi:ClC family H(+)/Cl(-) exchange transporter [Boudabousia marimammalium]|uniref:ClC family H(+)/Cl(-) exchange transporter n=2 Tax=Boudabousia marimammalium TaxID=156892 RepID=A0A1Q5PRY7_9ACTO|nr:ClC family H(+)/Cl(-) exchange transporter [Boudabousia marimammalium]